MVVLLSTAPSLQLTKTLAPASTDMTGDANELGNNMLLWPRRNIQVRALSQPATCASRGAPPVHVGDGQALAGRVDRELKRSRRCESPASVSFSVSPEPRQSERGVRRCGAVCAVAVGSQRITFILSNLSILFTDIPRPLLLPCFLPCAATTFAQYLMFKFFRKYQKRERRIEEENVKVR
jgi:hypothetical protein